MEGRKKWLSTARSKQVPPKGDWFGWLLLAGRGFGKTRPGAEETWFKAALTPNTRWAVVAPTNGDLRRTCFEGESGLLSVIPKKCLWRGDPKLAYNRAFHELKLFNGSMIQGFSATEPERMRGPQFHGAWCDELAAWASQNTIDKMNEAWDMLMFALRLGDDPRVIVTTTPKPFPLVLELIKRAKDDFVITTGSTYENKANLAPKFFKQVVKYEGTKLGDQEIHAKIMDLEEGGIYHREDFRLWPAGKEFPYFEYIVQSYDTAYTEKTENDPTACTTWGVFLHNGRKEVMLIDAWQEWMEWTDLRDRALKEYQATYGADAPPANISPHTVIKPGTMKNPLIGPSKKDVGRRPDMGLVEKKGSGITLLQELERKGIRAQPYNPGRDDKAMRAHAVSHLPPAGLVWMPESTNTPGKVISWAEDMMYQLCVNRKPWEIAPDDFLDTYTQAHRLLIDEGWLSIGDEAEKGYPSASGRANNPYSQ